MLQRICSAIERLSCLLLFVFLAVMVVVVFAQVVWRYVLSASIFWSEELSRYLMVWATLIASGVCLKRGSHMAVRFVHDALPPALRRWTALGVHLLILIFLAVVLRYGISLSARTWMQISPTLNLPMGAVYLCVPLGALLMAVQVLALLERIWRTGSVDLPPPESDKRGG